MRFSLKLKLLGGFGVVLALMLAMGGIAYLTNARVERANAVAMQKMEEIIFTVQKEVDHLDWLNNLANTFVLQRQFTGQLDHTQCDFGRWYYATLRGEGFKAASREFQDAFLRLEEPHALLHASAAEIVEIFAAQGMGSPLAREQALQVYRDRTQLYITEVRVLLKELQDVLGQEKEKQVAMAEAQNELSRRVIVLASLLALVLGVVMAMLLNRGITVPIKAVVTSLQEMAKQGGDLTRRIVVRSRDEVGDLASSFNAFVGKLNDIILSVRNGANLISLASSEISSGNQDLSQRTEEQASSLEEISSTVEEITSSLETAAANATEADTISKKTLQSVSQGVEVVRQMQGAMQEITRGSREISEIIAAVNDIAFQTNLLALNAAVEAARAGEQGRGFAVVAAEVRNLAGRSAASAKEIEKLIKDSIARVDKGNELMGETEKVLEIIVQNTRKTSDVVGEISASLREQSAAAADIRTAIEELNQVTQQNASLVEEIASSSENMDREATELSEMVGLFTLRDTGEQRGLGQRAVPPAQGGKAFSARMETKGKNKQVFPMLPGPGAFDEDDFEKF